MKRTHRLHEAVLQSVDLDYLHAIVRAETLFAARFEPAIRQGTPMGWLDLVFAEGSNYSVMPLIAIDLAMLVEPEDDALLWPHRVAARVDGERLDAIAARLYPWLYARSLVHDLASEQIHIFDPQRRAAFEWVHSAFAKCRDEFTAVRGAGVPIANETPLREARFGHAAVAVGGSSGRIALCGEFDGAAELARCLRAEGFSADLGVDASDFESYDVVHVFGVDDAEVTRAALLAARAAGKPTVLTPLLEDVAALGVWGTAAAAAAFGATIDQRELGPYLHHLAAHTLNVPGLQAGIRHQPSVGYEGTVRAIMAAADVVLVSGEDEERLVRERFGRAGPTAIVTAYVNADLDPEPVDHLVGRDPFVLCHARLEPRQNQLLAALAARDAALPIVFAGACADPNYAALVREYAGQDATFLSGATPGQMRSLYGCARVFLDAAWIGSHGLQRLAQAVACGCAVTAAHVRPLGSLRGAGLWEVDPASAESIAAGMEAAWNGADGPEAVRLGERSAALCDPGRNFLATIAAYAVASAAALNNTAYSAEILK